MHHIMKSVRLKLLLSKLDDQEFQDDDDAQSNFFSSLLVVRNTLTSFTSPPACLYLFEGATNFSSTSRWLPLTMQLY